MKNLICILAFVPLFAVAQVSNKVRVDSLRHVTDMPYVCETSPYGAGCGSKLFWEVVQQKESIIPFLIDKLADTTTTEAYVPNFGGQYTVADVAYSAISEIVEGIPTFELLGTAFDTNGCGYCSYWSHLRRDIKNRKQFQKAVRKWYNENRSNLIWVPSGQSFKGHHNGGMYRLKK